jgi:hypothetical protein
VQRLGHHHAAERAIATPTNPGWWSERRSPPQSSGSTSRAMIASTSSATVADLELFGVVKLHGPGTARAPPTSREVHVDGEALGGQVHAALSSA